MNTIRVRCTQGAGQFGLKDATAEVGFTASFYGMGAAAGDADADGDLDLYVSRYVEYEVGTDVFCGDPESDLEVERELLELLGKPTKAKKWLAASLDKTIRLHLSL